MMCKGRVQLQKPRSHILKGSLLKTQENSVGKALSIYRTARLIFVRVNMKKVYNVFVRTYRK